MIAIIISILCYDFLLYSCFVTAHRADVISGYYSEEK